MDDIDEQVRIATQDSYRSQREWQDRQHFRQQTRSSNVYEPGEGSGANVSGVERPRDVEFSLRSTNVDLARSQSMKQPKIRGGFLKTARKKLGSAVSKFLIYERLPMNLSKSPWLHNLIVAAAEVGKGVKCPTPYEVSDVYLDIEYNKGLEWLNTLKDTWKDSGVTIMCDGWTDGINHTHIMNFLVYCCKGTIFLKSIDALDVPSRNADYYFQLLDQVVEEVGEEFVVQVVTDNEAALKSAGQRLMVKRPHLYWSSCAAHCLDLCLEDIGKKKNIQKILSGAKAITTFIYNHIWTVNLMKKFTGGKEIIRPGVTRFATQFLQLQSIVNQKQGLRNMFSSEEFKKSKFGREKSGPAMEANKTVTDSDFWAKASEILKMFEPIVRVLRLVDGDEKPTMGYIYEAIDRAKQAIRQNSRYHAKYNEIIDTRWRFMHSDLHSAVYFLNPQYQFGVEHGVDVFKETFEGTNKVIMKLERDVDNQIMALNQVSLFKDKKGTFGTTVAQKGWSKMDPAQWWLVFGSCAPELQNVAVRILSQTTSATNCERNWSTFSYIHTKTRNRLKYKKLQKLVFTHYNMKLKMRNEMRQSQEEIDAGFNPINLDYIFQEDDVLSPWLEEREDPLLDGMQNASWLPLVDSDAEVGEGNNDDSNENNNGLSSSSNNSGAGGDTGDGGGSGNLEAGESGGGHYSDNDDGDQFQNDPYQELPIGSRRYRSMTEMVSSDNEPLDNYRRNRPRSEKGKRKQQNSFAGSTSSGIAQSFGGLSMDDSSQSSQHSYPPLYQHPYLNAQDLYTSDESSSYNQPSMHFQYPYPQQPSMNYLDSYHEQPSGGFFNYVFGQGATHDDNQNENSSYDQPRHSTMW